MSVKERVARSILGGFGLRVVALLIALAASIVLARSMGAQSFGAYSFLFALVTIFGLPSQAGIPALIVRETARSAVSMNWARIRGLWRWADRWILFAAITSAALMFGLAASSVFDPAQVPLLAVAFAAMLVPVLGLVHARGAALRGLHFVISGQVPETVLRPLLLTIFVASVWVTVGTVTPTQAMGAHFVAASVALAVGSAILNRATFSAPQIKTFSQADEGWARSVVPLAAVSGFQIVNAQAGVILTGLLSGAADVGELKVATAAGQLAVIGLQSANLIVAPSIAKYHRMNDIRRVQMFCTIGAVVGTSFTLPFLIVVLFLGREVVQLLYGQQFVGAYFPLVVLVIGQAVSSFFGSVGVLLNMTGNERISSRWLGAACATNILGCLLLVPRWGASGAAIAAATSMLFWNISFWISARAVLGVDASVLAIRLSHFRSAWAMVKSLREGKP